jgi:hypothetical protein
MSDRIEFVSKEIRDGVEWITEDYISVWPKGQGKGSHVTELPKGKGFDIQRMVDLYSKQVISRTEMLKQLGLTELNVKPTDKLCRCGVNKHKDDAHFDLDKHINKMADDIRKAVDNDIIAHFINEGKKVKAFNDAMTVVKGS